MAQVSPYAALLKPTWGMVAIALAATLWAIGGNVAGKLFQTGVLPFELAMARAVMAAAGLLVVDRLSGKSRPLFPWQAIPLGLSLALVTITYYVAIARLSVAVAIVLEYTSPVLVVVWMTITQRQKPSRPVVLALALALTGVILVSGVFAQNWMLDPLGLLAAGLSAVFFASYTLFSASLVHTYGAIGTMSRGFLVSSLFWVTVQATQGVPRSLLAPDHWVGVVFIGLGGTLLPFALFCWGIRQVRADRATIAATLEPVLAAAIAWIWLNQPLTLFQIIGGALVLGSVVMLQISVRRSNLG